MRPNRNLLRITQATLANQKHPSHDGKGLLKADLKPEIELNLDTKILDYIYEAKLDNLIQTKYLSSFCPQSVIEMDETAEHMKNFEDYTLQEVIETYEQLLMLFFSETSEQMQSDESLLPYRNALMNEDSGSLNDDYETLAITHAILHVVTHAKITALRMILIMTLIDPENLIIPKKDYLS